MTMCEVCSHTLAYKDKVQIGKRIYCGPMTSGCAVVGQKNAEWVLSFSDAQQMLVLIDDLHDAAWGTDD